jgi:hypothetical protein
LNRVCSTESEFSAQGLWLEWCSPWRADKHQEAHKDAPPKEDCDVWTKKCYFEKLRTASASVLDTSKTVYSLVICRSWFHMLVERSRCHISKRSERRQMVSLVPESEPT